MNWELPSKTNKCGLKCLPVISSAFVYLNTSAEKLKKTCLLKPFLSGIATREVKAWLNCK